MLSAGRIGSNSRAASPPPSGGSSISGFEMITVGISLAGGPPNGFPPAAALGQNDLIYMTQAGSEVAATVAQMKTALTTNAARETFTAGPNFTASISGAVLTVSAFASGAPLAVGQTVFGAGVNVGQTILSFGTGAGGTGTYNLSASQATVASEPMGAASSSQFAPGFSTSITLAGTYGSVNNILTFFDIGIQTDVTLTGQTLGFNPTVPQGIQQVVVIGGAAQSIGVPADGSVTAAKLASGAVTAGAIGINAIDGTKLNATGISTFVPTIQIGYNPSGLTSWTPGTPSLNVEGISVDINGYGTRHFGGFANIVAISGSLNIPAGSDLNANGIGIAGYVKNENPGATSNAVAVFGQADVEATGALVWGLNTVSADNGFATTVWCAELDINLSNVNSAAFGLNVVGGSTVEPANGTYGVWIGALGTFASTPLRWSKGVYVGDGSSITGIDIGCARVPGGAASGSMPIDMYFNPNSSGRSLGSQIAVDASGNLAICQAYASGGQLSLIVGGAAGVGVSAFNALASGGVAALAFYGGAAALKQTITGSRGGNAALTSTLAMISAVGLAIDATTP